MRLFLPSMARLRTLFRLRTFFLFRKDELVADGPSDKARAKACSDKLTPASPTSITGAKGENAAAVHVQALGWRILNRNWRHGSLELDIVALDGDTVVFLEVKTRRSGGMTSPLEALTPTKQERLIRAARHWIAAHNAWAKPCRFDLAAVTAQNATFNTELFHNVIELGNANGQFRKGRRTSGGGNTAWQPW